MDTEKPEYAVGCTGHINLNRIRRFAEREQQLRFDIRSYFNELKDAYKVTLYCGLANGADSLFAEEAIKCGIDVVAVLPEDWQSYMNEQKDPRLFMRLLRGTEKTVFCLNGYVGVMGKLVAISDEILTLWDGIELPLTDGNGNEINRGGTYDLIRNAQLNSIKIKHFNTEYGG